MAMPKVPVETTLAVPVPRGRLIDAASELPQAGPGDTGLKWLGGVTWNPHPCRALLTTAIDPCSPASLESTPNDCEAVVTQLAFQFYEVLRGSVLEYDRAALEAMLDERGDLLSSWALAMELAGANASGSGYSLKTKAHAPALRAFGTAAVPVREGLAYLVDDLGRTLRGGKGVIHMPPGIAEFANGDQILEQGDSGLRTKLGHDVVADAGYVDMPAPTGEAASAAGAEWVYASGPVWYRMSARDFVFNGDGADNQAFDMVQDRLTQILSRKAILVFDPCPVTAILVSYT